MMTRKEFDDLYLNKAVHCDTEEKANEFLKLAHDVGYEWSNHKSLLDINNYFEYKDKTCYKVNAEGITYASLRFYRGEDLTIVEFEPETIKENTMKYKVGDKVRVREDLSVNGIYGRNVFVSRMTSFKGKQVTIKRIQDEAYQMKEDDGVWNWTDEMLEPVETFDVGDVVYNGDHKRPLTLLRKAWVVCYQDRPAYEYFVEERDLFNTRPLRKITREELAEKGYELVD